MQLGSSLNVTQYAIVRDIKEMHKDAMKKRGPKSASKEPSGPHRNFLRTLRVMKGMTQGDVATAIGKTTIDISRLENGVIQMTEDYIRPLSKAFGWSASELLDGPSKSDDKKLSDAEIALSYAVKVIFDILLGKKKPTQKSISDDLIYALGRYKDANLPNAILLTEDLLAHVKAGTPQTDAQSLRKMLQLAPPGSA